MALNEENISSFYLANTRQDINTQIILNYNFE